MATYLPKRADGTAKTPFWHYDFKVRPQGGKSRRFHGSTGQRTKKAADRYEAKIRELAALGQLTSTITVDEACQRYWDEKLIHAAGADDQATVLETLKTMFGAETLLVSITPADVAAAAVKRARTPLRRYDRGTGKVVPTKNKLMPTAASVNRQVVEPMRRLLRYAKVTWGVPLDLDQFDWGKLTYAEPAERARELSVEEEDRLWAALRPDYHPIIEMYLISGRRRSDWIMLPKFKVDRTSGTIRFPTRKRKERGELVIELTQRELQIVREEWDKAPGCEFVFTYQVQHGPHEGKRKPITVAGLRKETDRAFAAAGLHDFRRHDLRHTFGSRVGRALKGDQFTLMKAMDHQDLASTKRYRHVMKSEVTQARSAIQVSRNETGEKSGEGEK